MHEHIVLSLAGIGLLGIGCQWFAWWVKLPAILFLLLAGIAVGPVLGWLEPEALFGHLLFPMISLAVAVILFEGGLSLRFEEIRGLEQVVRRMVSSGLLVTWLLVAWAVHTLLDFPWSLAILFGAITVVTGPTVIVPLLRTVRPTSRIANILRWEGIIIDPIGALLAVLVFEFIISGGVEAALEHTLIAFARILFVGGLLGVGAGYLLGVILRRHWLPEYLHNVATLALVFGVFALSNGFQEESGLLAITLMGIWLANMKGVPVEGIIDFKESLSLLLISGLFIILAARLDFGQLQVLGWGAVGVFAVMQFIARPLKVAICTRGSGLHWNERLLLAWIAPRGIVAAAMAALFAIRLEERGMPQAPLLVPLTFLVIIGTVVLQSATAKPLAQRLGVAQPEPKGLLIIGANPIARAIAEALTKQGFDTLLADTDWSNIRATMMHGLPTYYGNPVSEHADRHLDLVGMGRLLALSPYHETNALAALRYRSEFEEQGIFLLPPDLENGRETKNRVQTVAPGNTLFGDEITYTRLIGMLGREARIHATKLTENFDFDAYYKKYFGRFIPLFATDPKGRLHFYTRDAQPEPGPGWVLSGLIEPEEPPLETGLDTDAMPSRPEAKNNEANSVQP